MNSEKEILQFQKRLKDLAEKSYRQNVFTFTDFLGLAELDAYYRMEKELLFSHPALFGGDNLAERRLLRFGSPQELGYDEDAPIACLHVSPLSNRFSDDFSHRDFLGALMNLGIERGCIGDIRVGDKEGWLYCLERMADYICENLTQVRHTHVSCKRVEAIVRTKEEEPVQKEVLASSLRLDGCLSKIYGFSRTESLKLFTAGRVYVDGRLCENNSRLLKPGETVNVRGYGKFVFRGVKYETKKGKLCLWAEVYR